MENKKCVLLINQTLPLGVMANTATILGVSLGNLLPAIVGEDIIDASNVIHAGITALPFPILKSSSEEIKQIRQRAEEKQLTIVDFTDIAQTAADYSDYTNKALLTQTDEFKYLGMALFGEKKLVNKLTGSIGLLR